MAAVALAKFGESNWLYISSSAGADLGVVGTTCDEMVTDRMVTEAVTRLLVASSISERVSDTMRVSIALWVSVTSQELVADQELVTTQESVTIQKTVVDWELVAIQDFLLPSMGRTQEGGRC